MTATPARALALAVLADVESGAPLLAERLAQPDVAGLDPRERGLLHELVLGTLRRRGALDHALAPLVERELAGLDAPVLRILRLGAHQLLHLRVPARAAVSQSVELARASAPRASGFVNAVLRRLAREGPPAWPDARRDPLAWLTSAGSLPAWLAARWLERLGPAAAIARAQALAQPAPLALRLNPRRPDVGARLDAAGVSLRPLGVPGSFEATSGDAGALAREGLVYVQDQGSQLVAHLAAAGGAPLLDACAAPGGKTALAADVLGPAALIVAADASPRRLRSLAELLARWGAPEVRMVAADGRRPPFRGAFRTLLVDAPCSGLGTLARHPDLRWRAHPGDPARHAARQRALLGALAPLVSPGGRLVYAVCSLEREEGAEVVDAFLAARPDFCAETALPAWSARFKDGPWLGTRPERDGGDGFFVAVLRRT